MEKNSSSSPRRPQEHNRKPTVVKSGPQAGKARKGSVVNRGVRYDDPNSGKRTVSNVGDLAADEHDVVGGDAALRGFLPVHLRDLPANPGDVFDDIELGVRCDRGKHTLRWTRDGTVEMCDHDYVAESVLVALGGDKDACMLARDALTSTPSMSIMSPSWSLFQERNRSGHALAGVTVEGLGRHASLWEAVGRSGRPGAVAYVARAATDAWLRSLGAEAVSGNRGQVFVNRSQDAPPEEHPMGIFTRGNADGEGQAVGLYGAWGDQQNTRFVLNVNEEWYDNVRSEGFLVQGRLNLGRNASGQVVADVDPNTGEVYARLLAEGEILRPLDEVLAEGRRKQEDLLTPMRERYSKGGKVLVGELISWDYNDEYYFPIEGTNPVAVFSNVDEVVGWSNFVNVKEMFFNPFNQPHEYFEDESIFPDSYPSMPNRYDLMDACVNERVSLSNYTTEFATYSYVTAESDG